jgi:RNA polymerase sigma-70 factor (ECF subfamily)
MSQDETSGKRARFEAIALPLMTALYNVALRLVRHPEDAADVVQDTYFRAYRTFENFRPGTNARAWLFTILYSVVINRQKKAQREAQDVRVDEMEDRFAQFVDAPGATRMPDAAGSDPAHIDHMEAPEVEAALRTLPDAFRTAVLLVDVHEFSYEEAAAIVGCPVGTLRSRLFRGRRMLFGALQDYARRTGYLRTPES